MYGLGLHIGALALGPGRAVGSDRKVVRKRGQIADRVLSGARVFDLDDSLEVLFRGPIIDLVAGEIGQPGAVGIFGRRHPGQGGTTPHRTGTYLVGTTRVSVVGNSALSTGGRPQHKKDDKPGSAGTAPVWDPIKRGKFDQALHLPIEPRLSGLQTGKTEAMISHYLTEEREVKRSQNRASFIPASYMVDL